MDIFGFGHRCNFSFVVANDPLSAQDLVFSFGKHGQDQRGHNPVVSFHFCSDADSGLEKVVWQEGYYAQ